MLNFLIKIYLSNSNDSVEAQNGQLFQQILGHFSLEVMITLINEYFFILKVFKKINNLLYIRIYSKVI